MRLYTGISDIVRSCPGKLVPNKHSRDSSVTGDVGLVEVICMHYCFLQLVMKIAVHARLRGSTKGHLL